MVTAPCFTNAKSKRTCNCSPKSPSIIAFCLARCPCTNYFMYSMVMMAGPALFLLGLGFMMSGGFWQSLLETSRLQHYNERCNYRMKSLTRLFQPFLAPTAYITIALLKGEFFLCSKSGGLSNVGCKHNIEDTVVVQVRKVSPNKFEQKLT